MYQLLLLKKRHEQWLLWEALDFESMPLIQKNHSCQLEETLQFRGRTTIKSDAGMITCVH